MITHLNVSNHYKLQYKYYTFALPSKGAFSTAKLVSTTARIAGLELLRCVVISEIYTKLAAVLYWTLQDHFQKALWVGTSKNLLGKGHSTSFKRKFAILERWKVQSTDVQLFSRITLNSYIHNFLYLLFQYTQLLVKHLRYEKWYFILYIKFVKIVFTSGYTIQILNNITRIKNVAIIFN